MPPFQSPTRSLLVVSVTVYDAFREQIHLWECTIGPRPELLRPNYRPGTALMDGDGCDFKRSTELHPCRMITVSCLDSIGSAEVDHLTGRSNRQASETILDRSTWFQVPLMPWVISVHLGNRFKCKSVSFLELSLLVDDLGFPFLLFHVKVW